VKLVRNEALHVLARSLDDILSTLRSAFTSTFNLIS